MADRADQRQLTSLISRLQSDEKSGLLLYRDVELLPLLDKIIFAICLHPENIYYFH